MTRKRSARPRQAPSSTRFLRGQQRLGAAEFKARCLELMDRVHESGAEYIVTKYGRPVARLVPCKKAATVPLFGSGKGTVLKYERPFDPIDGEYDINRD